MKNVSFVLLALTIASLSVVYGIRVARPIDVSSPKTGRHARRLHPRNYGPLVNVTGGLISGETTLNGAVFLGVPFAAPPVKNHRFMPPQPVEPWSEPVRDATTFSKACLQPGGGLAPIPPSGQDEDCLYLNVYTPVNASSSNPPPTTPLPVMVWFYGGSFVHGAASLPQYNGSTLSTEGVVVVTVNYRLGVLGFATSDLLAQESPQKTSGNYGLMDQQAALKWVQNNIAAFGGNPNAVTIFGESAGAISVCMHTISPVSKGLFQRAIMESGPCTQGTKGPQLEPRESWNYNESVAAFNTMMKSVQCNDLRCLRQLPATTLLNNQGKAWWPVVDGYIIPKDPFDLYNAGQLNNVDTLIGTNLNDGTLFVPSTINATTFAPTIMYVFGQTNGPGILAKYPLSEYPSAWAAYAQIVTDYYFLCPSQDVAAQAQTAGKEGSYMYLWAHIPSWACPNTPFCRLGVFHSSEIAFVFGYESDRVPMTAAEKQLSKTMREQWATFARTGNPSTSTLQWPEYSMGPAGTNTMILNTTTLAPTNNWRANICQYWHSITDTGAPSLIKLMQQHE